MYAAEDKSRPIAIIVPAEPALKKLAQQNGIAGHGLEDLVHSREVNTAVLKELQTAGKQGGLSGIEIIDGVVLADEEWNPANVSSNRRVGSRPLTGSVGIDHGRAKDQSTGHFAEISERGGAGLCWSFVKASTLRGRIGLSVLLDRGGGGNAARKERGVWDSGANRSYLVFESEARLASDGSVVYNNL